MGILDHRLIEITVPDISSDDRADLVDHLRALALARGKRPRARFRSPHDLGDLANVGADDWKPGLKAFHQEQREGFADIDAWKDAKVEAAEVAHRILDIAEKLNEGTVAISLPQRLGLRTRADQPQIDR